MSFTWAVPPAVELSTLRTDLSLFSVSSSNSVAGDLLQLPGTNQDILLYDQERRYVMTVPKIEAAQWQILSYMTEDLGKDITELPAISLYLPSTASFISSYLISSAASEITNLTQFEATLEYLKIDNYVEQLPQLEQHSQALADYLQEKKVRAWLGSEQGTVAASNWIQYFDRYPPELSHLILAKLRYNWADLIYDRQNFARSFVHKFDTAYLQNQLSTVYTLEHDIQFTDNPNITLANLNQSEVRYNLTFILQNKYIKANQSLVTEYFVTHLDQLLKSYLVYYLFEYIDPQWTLDNLTMMTTQYALKSDKILGYLSKNKHLTSDQISKHMALFANYWFDICGQAQLSIDFIETTLVNHATSEQLNQLLFNKQVDITWTIQWLDSHNWLIYYDNPRFINHPAWTWAAMKDYLNRGLFKINDEKAKELLYQSWLQLEELDDILNYFNMTEQWIWLNYISLNPNLTEQFIIDHLDQFLNKDAFKLTDLREVAKHPSFTPAILDLILTRPKTNIDTSGNLRYLLQNPNFGFTFWLTDMRRYFPQSYQSINGVKIYAGDVASLQDYFKFYL